MLVPRQATASVPPLSCQLWERRGAEEFDARTVGAPFASPPAVADADRSGTVVDRAIRAVAVAWSRRARTWDAVSGLAADAVLPRLRCETAVQVTTPARAVAITQVTTAANFLGTYRIGITDSVPEATLRQC